jgi:UDP:flavonoid glycosyltransferase YjiC (YdhE family)
VAPRHARVLFVVPPAYGHLFPVVPLAWALRAAGHDVLVATCGIAVNAAARAGLAVVNVGRGVDLPALLHRYKDNFRQPFPPAADTPAAAEPASVFTELCDVMADGVVDAAVAWRADLVVYTPEAAAGLIAATRLGLPSVFFAIGLSHTPALMATRYATMQPTCARHDVAALFGPAASIHLSPPSLRAGVQEDGWPIRYVQYNGGQQWPIDLRRGRRPRIAVTLGTMVPLVCGLTSLRRIVDAARDVDATFVVAYGSESPRELGALPPNVEAHSWIALDALVATCDAAISHAGFGTVLAMLAEGLPQIVLPQGADQYYNADALVRRGAALAPDPNEITAATLGQLLQDAQLRRAAEEVRDEIAVMPPPVDVVPRLISLLR